jgi:hypothetical protein
MRLGDLPFGLVDFLQIAAGRINPVEAGNPPFVIAGTVRGGPDSSRRVRKPVIFVNVNIVGRDLRSPVSREIDRGEALLVDLRTDYSGEGRHRLEWAGNSWHTFDIEHRDGLTIGGIAGALRVPLKGNALRYF